MARRVPQGAKKGPKPITVNWKKWPKGLNTLVAPTKIRDDELAIANNIILVDEGSPVKRPGTDYWGTDAGGDTTQGMFELYKSNGDKLIAKIEDGFFRYWNGSSWNIVSNHSFATNVMIDATVLNDTLYLLNGSDPLTKFDGTSLIRYNLVSAPASTWATRGASLASGQFNYSYRVTAVSSDETGETDASTAYVIQVNKQRDQWNPDGATINEGNSVTVNWTTVTGAKGYNVYGVTGGDERFLKYIDGQGVSSWRDLGTNTPSQVFPVPTGNTTQGVEGNIITSFKTALLVGGDSGNPSRVYFSAGVDKPDSFLIGDGGGFIDVSKNTSDGVITALGTFQNKAIVGKERSIWEMDFTSDIIPTLTNVVQGIGCVSQRTLKPVENDLFFLGRKPGGGPAIYVLGNEPNYFSVLRTNELSSRVRPTMLGLQPENYEKAFAIYFNGRYMVFFTSGGGSTNNAVMIYDRERLGFTYWSEGMNVIYPIVYYDSNGDEYLLYTDELDNRVTEINESFTTDKGNPIVWTYKTKESDLDNPFLYKRYKWVNIRLRDVGGNVRVKLWTDSNTSAYSARIAGTDIETVFGSQGFGTARFGVTEDGGTTTEETVLTRRLPIGRQGINSIARSIALEVWGEDTNAKGALLDVQIKARPKSENYYPRDEVIN